MRAALLALLVALAVPLFAQEQPPFEVPGSAETENFRTIYYAVDKLSVLTTSVTYTSASTPNLWCVDSPTLCVDVTNHRVGVSSAAPTVALSVGGSITATGTVTGLTITGTTGTFTGLSASTITASSSFTATAANLTYANISSMTIAGPLSMSGVTNSSGTYLVSQGSTLTPKWQSAGLVFISTFANTTSTATSGATFGNTNITKTVTPHFSNSIFKISTSFEAFHTATTLSSCIFTLARDGTNLALGGGLTGFTIMTSSNSNQVPVSFVAVDSPNTTSAVTYTVQFRTGAASCTIDTPTRTLTIEEYTQ
jgi:hypothetical protein